MFFKAVVQMVLLFRLDTWVMNPRMVRVLRGGSAQGGHVDYRKSDPAASRWKLVVPQIGGGYAGGGVGGGGGVCTEEAYYGRTVHCDATDSVPLQGIGAEARYVGYKKVLLPGRA